MSVVARLELKNVAKCFPGRGTAEETTVLAALNLTIEDQELLVLVGPSGCGKSTLLRLIAGLEEPTSGQILLDGRDLTPLAPKARDVAMVFQNYALYPHLRVYDNLVFALRRRSGQGILEKLLDALGRSLPNIKYRSTTALAHAQRVQEIAQILQIESLLDRFPNELSGGQKQRVALGRAMVRNPLLYLMDEPLSNLDAQLRTQTRTQIVQWQQRLATTTIYVTHDQTEAMTMGTRIAVMNKGYLQQVGSPLEVYQKPANLFVAGFIGEPAMNLIACTVQGEQLMAEHFSIAMSGYPSSCPEHVTLGCRPEHLYVQPEHPLLQAQVEMVETLGSETLVYAIAPCGPLRLRLEASQRVQVGDTLPLGIMSKHLHLFSTATGQRL